MQQIRPSYARQPVLHRGVCSCILLVSADQAEEVHCRRQGRAKPPKPDRTTTEQADKDRRDGQQGESGREGPRDPTKASRAKKPAALAGARTPAKPRKLITLAATTGLAIPSRRSSSTRRGAGVHAGVTLEQVPGRRLSGDRRARMARRQGKINEAAGAGPGGRQQEIASFLLYHLRCQRPQRRPAARHAGRSNWTAWQASRNETRERAPCSEVVPSQAEMQGVEVTKTYTLDRGRLSPRPGSEAGADDPQGRSTEHRSAIR